MMGAPAKFGPSVAVLPLPAAYRQARALRCLFPLIFRRRGPAELQRARRQAVREACALRIGNIIPLPTVEEYDYVYNRDR